ncbi:MAG: hypothetical protein ACR2HN_01055 [Tepidiformaceae bacterium]
MTAPALATGSPALFPTAARRVAIIGNGGSGKSTLARELGPLLGLPVVHLDVEHWRPGWTEPPLPEWQARVRELVAAEAWVIDGNYGGTIDVRLAAADTVVFLDFPTPTCTWRVIKRATVHRRHPRPDMAEGCREKLDPHFIKWVWTYRRLRRPAILALLERFRSGRTIVVLRNPREMREWLTGLQAAHPPRPA